MGLNTILKANIEGTEQELYPKVYGDNVYLDDKTTLTPKIAEMVEAINAKAKDTDVMDIKIKYDGSTANTPGDAVREQIRELKGDLTDLATFSDNLYDCSKVTSGCQLIFTNGELNNEQTNYSTSDFIACAKYVGKWIYGSNASVICFYKANKTYISGFQTANYQNARIIPEECYYVRFSMNRSSELKTTLVVSDEPPTESPTYVPYGVCINSDVSIPQFDDVKNTVNNLKNKVDAIGDADILITSLDGFETHYGMINTSTLKWDRLNNTSHIHTVVPIERDGGKLKINVSSDSGNGLNFFYVTDYSIPTINGEDAHVIKAVYQYRNNIEYSYDIPEGTKYIIFETKLFDTFIYFNDFELYITGGKTMYVKSSNVNVLEDSPNEIFVGSIKHMSGVQSRLQTISMGDNACTIEQAGCVAIGIDALKNVTPAEPNAGLDDGYFNTAVGHGSMSANTTGNHNTAMGWGALGSNLTGSHNTCVGEDAGCTIKEGGNNTCIGGRAFQRGLGNNNTAIGQLAMFDHSTGSGNTYVGHASGNIANDTGWYNVGIGDTAICPNKRYSVALGAYSVATKDNQVVLGCDGSQKSEAKTTETIVFGDFIICGTDGIERKIVFNLDGTCSWVSI